MLPAPFTPIPSQEAEILDALSDPSLSLRAIAQSHHTTSAALSLWLATPQVAAQVRLIDDASSLRLRLISANALPSILAAAAAVLDTFNAEEKSLPPDPKTQAKRTDHATDCRARNTAMRAANLITRIARPTPPPRRSEPRNGFDSPPTHAHQSNARSDPLHLRGRAREGWSDDASDISTEEVQAQPAEPPRSHTDQATFDSPSRDPRAANLAAIEEALAQLQSLAAAACADPSPTPQPLDLKLGMQAHDETPASPAAVVPFEISNFNSAVLPRPPAPLRRAYRSPSNLTALAGVAPAP